SPFWVEFLAFGWQWNVFATCFERGRTQYWVEWIAANPFGRLDWLAVVMRVKDQRALCARRVDFAKDDWRHVGQFQQARFYGAPFQHLRNQRSVAVNIWQVASDVGQSQ